MCEFVSVVILATVAYSAGKRLGAHRRVPTMPANRLRCSDRGRCATRRQLSADRRRTVPDRMSVCKLQNTQDHGCSIQSQSGTEGIDRPNHFPEGIPTWVSACMPFVGATAASRSLRLWDRHRHPRRLYTGIGQCSLSGVHRPRARSPACKADMKTVESASEAYRAQERLVRGNDSCPGSRRLPQSAPSTTNYTITYRRSGPPRLQR